MLLLLLLVSRFYGMCIFCKLDRREDSMEGDRTKTRSPRGFASFPPWAAVGVLAVERFKIHGINYWQKETLSAHTWNLRSLFLHIMLHRNIVYTEIAMYCYSFGIIRRRNRIGESNKSIESMKIRFLSTEICHFQFVPFCLATARPPIACTEM